jgi:hypothetical protein
MPADRWLRIEELYHSAMQREPEHRAVFLEEACPDSDVRCEVETLLAQSADGVLDHPVADLVTGGRLGPYQILGLLGDLPPEEPARPDRRTHEAEEGDFED